MLRRSLGSGFGLTAIAFAVDRWRWFQSLPPSARLCGNCFLFSVAVPVEVGLLGTLLIAGTVLRISHRSIPWLLAALGVLLTPWVVGLPIFVLGLLALSRALLSPRLWRLLQWGLLTSLVRIGFPLIAGFDGDEALLGLAPLVYPEFLAWGLLASYLGISARSSAYMPCLVCAIAFGSFLLAWLIIRRKSQRKLL